MVLWYYVCYHSGERSGEPSRYCLLVMEIQIPHSISVDTKIGDECLLLLDDSVSSDFPLGLQWHHPVWERKWYHVTHPYIDFDDNTRGRGEMAPLILGSGESPHFTLGFLDIITAGKGTTWSPSDGEVLAFILAFADKGDSEARAFPVVFG